MNKLKIKSFAAFFLLIGFIAPLDVKSQSQSGVAFINDLSWNEILEKAQRENKYIFVDCYTTWCGPCKYMDKNIYSSDSIGAAMNENFISVKVQMDSTKKDDQAIKRWYAVAKKIGDNYNVTAYPTFLFFSPNGDVVHKDQGMKDVPGFLKTVSNAVDRDKQYYILLEKFKTGAMSKKDLIYWASRSKELGDTAISNKIAATYIDRYIFTDDSTKFDKENISFMASFGDMISLDNKYFNFFYNNSAQVNKVMQDPMFSQRVIDNTICREMVYPVIELTNSGKEPSWLSVERDINVKYGKSYAERNLLRGKITWAHNKKNWAIYTKNLVMLAEKFEISNLPNDNAALFYLNNNAFEIFSYSKNNGELKTALKWVDKAMQIEGTPSFVTMDTKANLLYKLGKKVEAIQLEAKAAALAPDEKSIQAALEKMKRGDKTW